MQILFSLKTTLLVIGALAVFHVNGAPNEKDSISSQLFGRAKRSLYEGMVAFQAKLTKNQKSLPENAIVIFETTTLNAGYAYSPLTGIFTAPEDGIYVFSWNILAHAGGVFHTEIVYNGKAVAHNHADGRSGSSHYASGSSTAVIGMRRKDQVWIKAMAGHGESAAGDWSSFSGFKL